MEGCLMVTIKKKPTVDTKDKDKEVKAYCKIIINSQRKTIRKEQRNYKTARKQLIRHH